MPTDVPNGATEDLALLKSAAVHAGIIALGYYKAEIKTWTKNVSSPVSEADIAVDDFLRQSLRAARPDYGWLSEETVDSPDRLDRERVFVIDPIDGTRGFIRGDDNWTISLAVVENGRPVAGVVYAPVRNEMFAAAKGMGAKLNDMPLAASHREGAERIIPAATAVHRELANSGLRYVRGPYYASLAYRLVQVAADGLDAAAARRGAQDWDIAGADIILGEAGIALTDVCFGTPIYNKPDTRHAALAASADPSLNSPLRDALRVVYGCPQHSSVG